VERTGRSHWFQSLCGGPPPLTFLLVGYAYAMGSHVLLEVYAMIVNTDFTKSHYCQPEFRSAPKQLRMVSPYTGQLGEFSGEEMWLAAGQGVLLKVQ